MDLLNGLQIQIDALWYNLLMSLATLHWGLLRGFILMGYTVELLNDWLAEQAFAPLISQTNASLQVAISAAFVIALLVLGITYMLAAFVRLDVVRPRNAIMWYAAGALFFSLGPSLYMGLDDFRRGLAEAFYISTLTGLQSSAGGAFGSLNAVNTTEMGLIPICDNLGTYLPGVSSPQGIDGLDIALAYVRADGIDIMGYHPTFRDPACQAHTPDGGGYIAGPIPWEWSRPDSYFDTAVSSQVYASMTPEERADSIQMATAAQGRLLTAWPLVLFGVTEQIVYLLITIAQGITFISFSIAILFAFFRKTEVIARAILDQWLELIVQTVIIALIQALVVAFFLTGSASGNGMVVLGVGLICLVCMLIVFWSGVRAVWNSLNRIFSAMSQVAGGTIASPGSAGAVVATGALGAAGFSVGAMAGYSALQQGATPAQAAGITFGESQTLNRAARTMAYLPGLRDSALGTAAEQFTEGALTRQVARQIPIAGAVAGPAVAPYLLTDRNPDTAKTMLVPAVANAFERITTPTNSRSTTDSTQQASANTDGNTSPQRMGTFTPDAQTTRLIGDNAMQGEEIEQHIADVMRTATGTLRVNGVQDVASTLADSLRVLQHNNHTRTDHLTAANVISQQMGVTPVDGQTPMTHGAARFGLLLDQALQAGITPERFQNMIQAVKANPSGTLPDDVRQSLINDVQNQTNQSWESAAQAVDRLAHAAHRLPTNISVYGQINQTEGRTDDA